MSKYLFFDPFPYGAHMRILNAVNQSSGRVLDVGCGAGGIGKKLKEKGFEVIGIEKDHHSALVARDSLDEVLELDVENQKQLPFGNEYFDLILFVDVLEHFTDPLSVLIKLQKYLKTDGAIVCSIPNIVNFNPRIQFFLGKFHYDKYGIFDETHLRFFTLQSAKQLIFNAGFNVELVDYSANLSVSRPFKWFRFSGKLGYFITKRWPTLFACQFILRAKKSDVSTH